MAEGTERFELIALDRLDPHPRNPRVGDIPNLVETMATLGWWGTAVVQWRRGRRRTLLAGEHRWRALRQLCAQGWIDPDGRTWSYGELAAKVSLPPEGAMFCDVRRVDDATALAMVLSDNRAPDLAAYDDMALLDALRAQAAGPLGLLGTGWTLDELEQLGRDAAPILGQIDQPTRDPSMLVSWSATMTGGQRDRVVALVGRARQAHPDLENVAGALIAALEQFVA